MSNILCVIICYTRNLSYIHIPQESRHTNSSPVSSKHMRYFGPSKALFNILAPKSVINIVVYVVFTCITYTTTIWYLLQFPTPEPPPRPSPSQRSCKYQDKMILELLEIWMESIRTLIKMVYKKYNEQSLQWSILLKEKKNIMWREMVIENFYAKY